MNRKLICISIVSSALLAQQAAPPAAVPPAAVPPAAVPPAAVPPNIADSQPDTLIERSTVSFVQAPTTVTDRSGSLVDGLQPNQFRLFDNGKEQDIHVDVALQPISIVVAIQCTDVTEAVLKQIQRSASLFGPQMVGENGEAAVLAFDNRIREMQNFTNDPAKITDAIRKIHAGGTQARIIDVVDKATYMLRARPASRRRVILLISETHDQSSESRLKETLVDAQLSNVTIYTVNISHLVTSLTGKSQPPRPDAMPATGYTLPGGQPSTPTTIEHKTMSGQRAEFVPLAKELYKDVKGLFVDNTATLLTEQTGGREFSFFRQRGLEDAIEAVGTEIHSQYMISYNPNNKTEGGFHEIEVRLDRPEYSARTRPGYYLASLGK